MDQQTTQDATQLLTWLDEQQREDRRQLAALQTLAETQGRGMEDLTQRFESLERRLAGTQAQLARFAEIEAALQELKNEILGVVEASENRLRKIDAQLESRLEAQSPQLANLAKTLKAVQSDLTALRSQVETMPARIDGQVEQAAGLARDIEGLETRFNQTQARLAQLNERLSNQTDSMAALSRQLEHLEGRLSSTQAQLVKFPQIEAALQEAKNEIVFMIHDLEAQRAKEARQSAELREAEQKNVRVALDNIRKRLEPIPQLDERIKALAAEDQRLRGLISEQEQRIPPLSESIQEHRDRISYLEEGASRTSHRTDELEVKIPPLHKAIEENAGQIQFLQEWAQRSAEKIDELKRFEDRMERWRTAFIEEIRQAEQRRDRRLGDWEATLGEYEDAMDRWRETLRRYELAYQDNRRTMGDLQALAQRLERDQAEVAEQQRLADERLQRELEAWQEENEKRWHFFLKQRDYDWEQETKHDAEQDGRLELLEIWRAEITDRFAEELDRLDENDRRVLQRLVSLIRHLDAALDHQISHQSERRAMLSEEIQSSDVLVTRAKKPGD
jgi:chromosome segregation ATPase